MIEKEKMKAAIYKRYGAPEVLELVELPKPPVSANEVLVSIKAVGLNPKDSAIRAGMLKLITGRRFPKQTGFDFSGVIVERGEAVTSHKIGEEVFGYIEDLKGGAAAEFLAVTQNWIAKKPGAVTHTEIAATPCAYLTALQALRDTAKLKANQKVLIYGASGGVGTAAIQLAKHFGAEVTTVSNSKNKDYCARLGANKTLAYDTGDVFENLHEEYDVFLQVHVLSGSVYHKARRVLKKRGVFVTLTPNPLLKLQGFISKILSRPTLETIIVKSRKSDLEEIAQLVAQGILKPQIQQKFALSEIAQAHRMIETQHTRGKIVLEIR